MKTSIAIDLGGTRIKVGIVNNGEVLNSIFVDAFSGKGLLARLPVLEESIDHLLNELKISAEDIAGIGISIPGIVDSRQMKLLSVNKKFSDAVGFDFPAWAQRKWNKPLVIENDARCALVGEWQYGAGKGSDNLVMMTLGTGVGGAAIIEGNLLRGKHFQASRSPQDTRAGIPRSRSSRRGASPDRKWAQGRPG
jgi:glucokinase